MTITLGALLRDQRKGQGLSIAEISHDITSPSSVSRFERGQTELSATKFMQLMRRAAGRLDWPQFELEYSDPQDYMYRSNVLIGEKRPAAEFYALAMDYLQRYEKSHWFYDLAFAIIARDYAATRLGMELPALPPMVYPLATHYLLHIQHWQSYDALLAACMQTHCSLADLRAIVTSMAAPYRHQNQPPEVDQTQNMVTQGIMNIIRGMMMRGEFATARELLPVIDTFPLTDLNQYILRAMDHLMLAFHDDQQMDWQTPLTQITAGLTLLTIQVHPDQVRGDWQKFMTTETGRHE